jgi:hypothetical protein
MAGSSDVRIIGTIRGENLLGENAKGSLKAES